MDHGDVLLLETDGVTDIQNLKGEQFGTERLHQLLNESKALSAEGIRNAIYQECVQHRGEADQFDDFTLIVLKRLGSPDSSFDEIDFD
jgi:sigma-B regulation protein RsbU (phosphoserine phosphatase)